MGGVETAIVFNSNGMCFTLFYYEKYMCPQFRPEGWYRKESAVPGEYRPVHQRLAIEGVEPNEETIGQRQYPLTTEAYVVVREPMAENYTAHIVRDWCLSAAGQQVAEQVGHVPYHQ